MWVTFDETRLVYYSSCLRFWLRLMSALITLDRTNIPRPFCYFQIIVPSTSKSRFDFRQITTHVRPPRIAIFLPESFPHWKRACLSILQWTSQIWGGQFVPIIPTDGKTVSRAFLEIIEAFDPDCLFYYQPDGRDLEDSNPEAFEEVLEEQLVRLRDDGDEPDAGSSERMRKSLLNRAFYPLSISDELKRELADWVNPFDPHHNDTLRILRVKGRDASVGTHLTEILDVATTENCRGIGSYDYSNLPTTLTLFTSSVLGITSSKRRKERQNVMPEDSRVEVNLDNVDQLLAQVWRPVNLYGETSPLKPVHALTNLNCVTAQRGHVRRYEEPTVVVCGDTLQDFCLYRSLRSVKRHTYWLPEFIQTEGDEEKLSRALGRIQWEVAEVVLENRVQRRRGETIAFVSNSYSREQLESVPQWLDQNRIVFSETSKSAKQRAIYPESIQNLLKYRFEVFENGNVDHRSILQFDQGRSIEQVPTPKPKHFNKLTLSSPSWIADVEIENYDLPRRPKLGPDTLQATGYDTNWVRVTSNGFSYYCPNHTFRGSKTLEQILARPKVHLKAPLALFEDVFGEAGYVVQPSDKGNYQIQAFSRVGGFDALCEMVCKRSARSVFYKYVEEEVTSSKDGSVVVVGDRIYLTFEGIAEASGSEASAATLIDQFTELSVIRRGLILQCQYCRKAEWYGLSGLSQRFECRRCHEEQFIQRQAWKQPKEGPNWYYQLDEIIYQFFYHNNHVPLLALNAMKEQSGSFIHTPELELRRDPSTSTPDMEIDVCAISNGRVVIGEATTGTNKTQDDLDRYLRIAEEVGAKQVVFATLDEEWSDDYRAYGDTKFSETRVNLRFMTREDLLPDPGSGSI